MDEFDFRILAAVGVLAEEGKAPPYSMSQLAGAVRAVSPDEDVGPLPPDWALSSQDVGGLVDKPWAIGRYPTYTRRSYNRLLNSLTRLQDEDYIRVIHIKGGLVIYPMNKLIDSVPKDITPRFELPPIIMTKVMTIDLRPRSVDRRVLNFLDKKSANRFELSKEVGLSSGLVNPIDSEMMTRLIVGDLVRKEKGLFRITDKGKEVLRSDMPIVEVEPSGPTAKRMLKSIQGLSDNPVKSSYSLAPDNYRPRVILPKSRDHKILGALSEGRRLTEKELGKEIRAKGSTLKRHIGKLAVTGLIDEDDDKFFITDKGRFYLHSALDKGDKADVRSEEFVMKFTDRFPAIIPGGE